MPSYGQGQCEAVIPHLILWQQPSWLSMRHSATGQQPWLSKFILLPTGIEPGAFCMRFWCANHLANEAAKLTRPLLIRPPVSRHTVFPALANFFSRNFITSTKALLTVIYWGIVLYSRLTKGHNQLCELKNLIWNGVFLTSETNQRAQRNVLPINQKVGTWMFYFVINSICHWEMLRQLINLDGFLQWYIFTVNDVQHGLCSRKIEAA